MVLAREVEGYCVTPSFVLLKYYNLRTLHRLGTTLAHCRPRGRRGDGARDQTGLEADGQRLPIQDGAERRPRRKQWVGVLGPVPVVLDCLVLAIHEEA